MTIDAKSENLFNTKDNKEVVIYEDEQIKVLFWSGNSERIVVTFGDLISLAKETRYFADTPLKKLGLSSIGFMAKRGNWFPQQSMHLAAKKALPIISKYKKNVLYGGSMGGYAALKYSKLLKGNVIISLCPQWSIDPIQCEGFKTGYEKHFTQELTGMGITKEDLAGKIFTFYDPSHAKDSFHIKKIKELGYPIHITHVPYSGHHVTTVLAGTKSISLLIDQAEHTDLQGLRSTASTVRRSSAKRAQIVIEKASTRHPLLAGRLINTSPHQAKLDSKTLSISDSNILGNIDIAKHPKVALPVLNRIISRNKCSIRGQRLSALHQSIQLKPLSYTPGIIQTHHNSFLCYDLSSGKLTHRSRDEIDNKPTILTYVLACKLKSGASIIGIMLENTPYLCIPDKSGNTQLIAMTIDLEKPEKFICIKEEAGKTRLTYLGNYVCANRRGDLEFNKQSASHWETYKIQDPR